MGGAAVAGPGVNRLFLLGLLGVAVPQMAAQTTVVVVTGVGGSPGYDSTFHAWATTLLDAATLRYGVPPTQTILLAADTARADGRAAGPSTKTRLTETLARISRSLPADGQLVLVLIGHGSYRDGVSRFNIPGADLTAEELARALAAFGDREVVVANLSSASGEFLKALSGPHRIVITATKSGMERNASMFGGHFAEAFAGNDADADNDGRVSILEAFNYAAAETAREYERDKKLLTEHAQLDDNGDGKGSATPSRDGPDGMRAAVLLLSSGAVVAAARGDSALAALYKEKQSIEQRIAELRQQKAQLADAEYERRLEDLLVSLARANREIAEREKEVP